MKSKLKENERIDDLQYKNLKIIQNKEGFCFGIDSIILANFVGDTSKDSFLVDLGMGTGILSILLCKKKNIGNIIGVEIQRDVAEMAKRSIELNKLDEKIQVINSDIKNIIEEGLIRKNTVDIIVTNPPYKESKSGIINTERKKMISRHETTATLKDFIEISSYLLKDKGAFYMVHKPERLVDIIYLLRQYKIEAKEIRFVFSNKEEQANLVLIKGIKGANKFLKVDSPLYIYNTNKEYSDEIKNMYNN